ncbi:MAG: GNAT family N-acetyltransferase [Caldilineaceae bacterium]
MHESAILSISAVTATDEEALAGLISEFCGLPTSADQIRQRLARSTGIEHPVLARFDQEVVGFASLRLLYYLGEDAPYAEISELYVRAAYRQQGIGRALLAVLETEARRAGATGWSVLTGEDNHAARALYERMGFQPFSIALQTWFGDERPYREG